MTISSFGVPPKVEMRSACLAVRHCTIGEYEITTVTLGRLWSSRRRWSRIARVLRRILNGGSRLRSSAPPLHILKQLLSSPHSNDGTTPASSHNSRDMAANSSVNSTTSATSPAHVSSFPAPRPSRQTPPLSNATVSLQYGTSAQPIARSHTQVARMVFGRIEVNNILVLG